MTQQEIAQAAKSWRKEDEENRAVIIILVEKGGSDIVMANLKGLDTYAYALSRLFQNSDYASIAAEIALKVGRAEKGNED